MGHVLAMQALDSGIAPETVSTWSLFYCGSHLSLAICPPQ